MTAEDTLGVLHHGRYLRRREAASFLTDVIGLPRAASTLAKLAVQGGGPPFRKAGRIALYKETDLRHWASQRIGPLQKSTSHQPQKGAVS